MRIQTAQNVEIDFEAAGLGDRVIAALLDYFVLFAYLIAAGILAVELASTAAAVVLYLPLFLYFPACEIFLDGQSVGKRARSLKVVRLDGGQPSLGNYLLRWLLRLVDIDLTFGMVALVTAFVGGKGQRLGDVAAGTSVVKILPRVELRDTIFATLDADYRPTFHQVEALEDGDVATAKDVLNALLTLRRSHTTHLLETKMKAVLERKMGLSSELPPVEFLRRVIKDYNYVKGTV